MANFVSPPAGRAGLTPAGGGATSSVMAGDDEQRAGEEGEREARPAGGLGILFLAAALALAALLSIVALIGYYALSRSDAPAGTTRTARLSAPVSGQR